MIHVRTLVFSLHRAGGEKAGVTLQAEESVRRTLDKQLCSITGAYYSYMYLPQFLDVRDGYTRQRLPGIPGTRHKVALLEM